MGYDKNKDAAYIAARTALFEDTVVDMVEHIVEELISDPYGEIVKSEYKVSEKEAHLTIYVPQDDLKEVVGKRNDTLAAIRKIAYKVSQLHGFFLVLSIEGYTEI